MTNATLVPQERLPKWALQLAVVFSLLLWAYSWLRAVMVPMTFDEVWSLNSYAQGTVADILACQPVAANNHLGNSLLMKACLGLFGDSPLALRLPNVLAHAMYMGFAVLLARRFRQAFWFLLAVAMLNLQPYLLDFFSLARGYGLAMAMVMGCLHHLWAYQKHAFTRHLIWNAAFAALAVLCNFSFLHFWVANAIVLTALVLGHQFMTPQQWGAAALATAKQLIPLATSMLILYLLMRVPVKALIEAKEFYYGGQSGFWSDTVFSLAHATLYKLDFWKYDVHLLLTFCLVAVVGMYMVFALEFRENGNHFLSSPGLIALALLLLPAITTTVQHFVMDSPFLIYRTALFLVPVFMLGWVWMLRGIARVDVLKPVAMGVGAVVLLALGFVNARSLNLRYAAEWPADADTPAMLSALQADLHSPGDATRPIALGLSWQLRPVVNYYRDQMDFSQLQEALNKGCQPGMDYYFVLGEGDGCKLPADQLPFGDKQGCTLLHSWPQSGTSLWRGPAHALPADSLQH